MTFFAPARIAQAGAAIAAALLVAGTAAPASASTVPGTSASASDQRQSADQTRRICVRLDMPNTRLPRRVCKTQAEWDREGGIPSSN